MHPVKTLDGGEIEEGLWIHDFQGFAEEAFTTLAELAVNPCSSNYFRLEARLEASVKRPMRSLFKALAPCFESRYPHRVEARKSITSCFRKNDYGRGGFYGSFWGALYRKGLSRRQSPQLCIKLYPDRLACGFALGSDFQGASL